VDHTDRGGWVCATPQQLAAGIQQGLPGCLAYDLFTALKAGIEAVVTALAAMIKGGRNYDGNLGYRAGRPASRPGSFACHRVVGRDTRNRCRSPLRIIRLLPNFLATKSPAAMAA
jgi:quinol monooxygenase YgiN